MLDQRLRLLQDNIGPRVHVRCELCNRVPGFGYRFQPVLADFVLHSAGVEVDGRRVNLVDHQ
jgi:hypothetical protein